MIRTRAQRRYRRQGYTWETASLAPCHYAVKTIVISRPGPWGWRAYRPYLLDYLGETIRPVATYYIHNGRKPRGKK